MPLPTLPLRRPARRVSLAAALLLAVGAPACRDSITDPWSELPDDAVPHFVSAERDSAFRAATGTLPAVTLLHQRRGFVVRDSAQWVAVWDSVQRLQRAPRPIPRVDFSSEMVIVAAAGLSSMGMRIAIADVHLASSGLWVRVLDGHPDTFCVTERGQTPDTRQPAPVAMRLVPVRDGEPRYLVRGGTLRCEFT